MPTAYILVGVPGSGKSTWISKQPFDWENTVIASTDGYVEGLAKRLGKTYNDVFKNAMPDAVAHMANTVTEAVKDKFDIVWDQTNTTVAARARKLRMLSKDYKKIAVVFDVPEEAELARRIASRPGKTIPQSVMSQMIGGYQPPTKDEGFDQIWHV